MDVLEIIIDDISRGKRVTAKKKKKSARLLKK